MSLGTWLVKKLSNYMLVDTTPSRSYLCDFSRIRHEVRTARQRVHTRISRRSRSARMKARTEPLT